MRGESATEGFWRFSLMIYARPGIADALIRLQDRAGHNVNLILFGLWLALCETIRLNDADLANAKAAIAEIDRKVVMPLRDLRRTLKADPDPDIGALRRRVLTLEIAAERRAQARLAASIGRREARGGGDRHALGEANLRLILGTDFETDEAVSLRRAIADF